MKVGSTVYWLHGNHLGSVSLTTNSSGGVYAQQRYYPYGEVRWQSGSLPTDLTFTGQRAENGLGLMDYRARFYSGRLGRFLSADTLVPGAASSSGGGAATLGYNSNTRLTPLTVGFHEPQFLSVLNAENAELVQFGPPAFWNGEVRRQHIVPMGPINPQALNRYAYCLNNALRYVDPSGHDSGGNEDIGYRQVKDDQNNPVKVNGQSMFQIWYFGEELYVTGDSPEFIRFMEYANDYATASRDFETAVQKAGGSYFVLNASAAAFLGGFALEIPSVGTNPIGWALMVAGGVGLLGSGYLVILECIEADNRAADAFSASENALDVFMQMANPQYKYNVSSQFK